MATQSITLSPTFRRMSFKDLNTELARRSSEPRAALEPPSPPAAPSNVRPEPEQSPFLSQVPSLDLGVPALSSEDVVLGTTTLAPEAHVPPQSRDRSSLSRATTMDLDPTDEFPALSRMSVRDNIPFSHPPTYTDAEQGPPSPTPATLGRGSPSPLLAPTALRPFSPARSTTTTHLTAAPPPPRPYSPDVANLHNFHSDEWTWMDDNISIGVGEVEELNYYDEDDDDDISVGIGEVEDLNAHAPMRRRVLMRARSPAPECMRLRLPKKDWRNEDEGGRGGFLPVVKGLKRGFCDGLGRIFARRVRSKL